LKYKLNWSSPVNLVVIPAYNEESTVGAVVRAVGEAAVDADVVVVDDRSQDATALRAREAGAEVIRTGRRHGYGAAIIRGFEHALAGGYEAVATIDADGQHDPASLATLFGVLAGADVASGSRYHPASPPGVGAAPPDRIRINREITELVNCVTGWTLTDAFCGLKAYRTAPLGRLRLDEEGYAFPLQFWIRAWQAGLRVVEVPVEKIYLSVRREFGNGLDNAETRGAYYRRIIQREVAEAAWSPCLDPAV
jgi:dolichol-phosphate mannosyltransferase